MVGSISLKLKIYVPGDHVVHGVVVGVDDLGHAVPVVPTEDAIAICFVLFISREGDIK